jgi:hypothetical protein
LAAININRSMPVVALDPYYRALQGSNILRLVYREAYRRLISGIVMF